MTRGKTHKVLFFIFIAVAGARFIENRTPVAQYGPVCYALGLKEEAGNVNKAVRYYRNAVRYEPQLVDAYWRLSEIYLDRSDYDRSVEYAQKAVALNSWYHKAYNTLGLAYRAQKQFVSALVSFQRALLWPFPKGAPEYVFNIGITALDLNDRALAEEQVMVLETIGEDVLAQRLQGMIER